MKKNNPKQVENPKEPVISIQGLCISFGELDVLKGIDFSKAEKDLTVICLNLMQNVGSEEQKKLAESIKNLAEPKAVQHELTKSVALGITLARITGVRLLKQAIETLGDEIKISVEKKKVFENLDQLESKL
jgi:hypothetical protein